MSTDDNSYDPSVPHKYTSLHSPTFRTSLFSGKRKVRLRFKDNMLTLYGEHAKEMDRCLALPVEECQLSLHIRKLDKEAAAELVRQHQAARRGAAVKGGFDTRAIELMKAKTMEGSAKAQATMAPNAPEAVVSVANKLYETLGGVVETELVESTTPDGNGVSAQTETDGPGTDPSEPATTTAPAPKSRLSLSR